MVSPMSVRACFDKMDPSVLGVLSQELVEACTDGTPPTFNVDTKNDALGKGDSFKK